MDRRIISASRRTDIPAFYAKWFMNRVRDGYCYYPNPVYRGKFHRVDLTPGGIAGIVFWTRWPKPLMRSLDELDGLGLSYYFQFTVVGYPGDLDGRSPTVDRATRCFVDLARKLGAHRVIWRYDPVILTADFSPDWHLTNFRSILSRLGDSTERVVLSVVDPYKKTTRRLVETGGEGVSFSPDEYAPMLREMVALAHSEGIPEVTSCAEPDLAVQGLQPGRCIDGELFDRLENERCSVDLGDFTLSDSIPSPKKIPKALHNQRAGCLCHRSVDIGANNTCGFGCAYCYATASHGRAAMHVQRHDATWNCLTRDVKEDASR